MVAEGNDVSRPGNGHLGRRRDVILRYADGRVDHRFDFTRRKSSQRLVDVVIVLQCRQRFS